MVPCRDPDLKQKLTKTGYKLTKLCSNRGKCVYNKTEIGEGDAEMAEFLAKRITREFIRKFHIAEENWDLYYLGIEVITTTVLTSLLIICCGILLHNGPGSVAFLLCFTTIRGYSGGYHAKTRKRCLVATMLCYVCSLAMMKGLLWLQGLAQSFVIVLGILSAVVIFIKRVPAEHPSKKLHEEIRERNRLMSFVLLFVWYLVSAFGCALRIYEVSAQIWATTVIIAILLCITRRKR